MPNNATSDYISGPNNSRIQQLEDALNALTAQGKQNSLTYKVLLAQHTKEYKKISDDFNRDFEKHASKFVGSLNSIAKGFISGIDSTINNYIGSIEKLTYSLNGNARNYANITSNLNKVLNGQNIVNQEKVFNNLSDIINKGIINNPEQKAFLQTLSQDLGMQFNVSNDTMRQLIRIQGEDSTANRMAIEYSLNEFLVQNYQTGEYIRQGFTEVSRALLMSQSTMGSAMAASYEATVQTWMGSLYSNGVSQGTISQLAAAIDAVGSGNISNLGQGISNLVLMGAARAGLDYGELLNRGYQGNDVNRLMQGITSYIGEMGNNSSNVVMNQLGNLFGLNIADIMAIRKNGVPNVAGVGANTDITSMLSGATGLVPGVVRLMNGINNLQYGFAGNLLANEGQLLNYEIAKKFIEPVGGMAGSLISGVGSLFGPVGSWLGSGLGKGTELLLGNASLIPLIMANWGQGNLKNIGSLFSGLYNQDNGVSALKIWEALAGGNSDNISVVTSSAGTSGSMGISRGGGRSGSLLDSFKGSMSDLGIEETTGDEITVDQHISSIDNTVQSISDILERILSAIPSSSSSSFDYSSRTGGVIYGQAR